MRKNLAVTGKMLTFARMEKKTNSNMRIGGVEVYRIGRLGKAHGIHGEVSFHFDDDIFDRTDADCLIIETDGILVPFFIEEYRFRSDCTALVKFEGMDSQERARELTNCDVYFPRHLAETDAGAPLTPSFLVGFTVTDAATGRRVGTIESIDDSTMNVLFCLDNGVLIPVADELVASVDKEKREIAFHIPEGLLEL